MVETKRPSVMLGLLPDDLIALLAGGFILGRGVLN
jgi:hypothetical protein